MCEHQPWHMLAYNVQIILPLSFSILFLGGGGGLGGGLRRFADYIKIQSWFTTSCKEKALSSHVSSFRDQSLGAVIYSTLSETPLPGGRVIVCMQMLIILSCPEFGMWIIPPVQWRSRREEREGRNWNSSSAPPPPTSQPLAPVIFSAMKLKMSLY